jgi:hypothetical protein
MKRINLDVTGLKELNSIEIVSIDGGHDGTAYQIGKAVNTVIIQLGDIAKSIIGALI